ncbi:hypothetical protein ACFXOD_27350 [Streptomyces sp. NPDC059161]|uniref:hypothetical protein n=1 Tax=Streptomyces sp. NPDC059161 TaxID=3346749 RepID=UPI0036B4FA09
MAQIEGLYTALRLTSPGPRRDRLAADLTHAARRLAAVTLASAGEDIVIPPRSRWQRRRALAARGANWIITRTAQPMPDGPGQGDNKASGGGASPL